MAKHSHVQALKSDLWHLCNNARVWTWSLHPPSHCCSPSLSLCLSASLSLSLCRYFSMFALLAVIKLRGHTLSNYQKITDANICSLANWDRSDRWPFNLFPHRFFTHINTRLIWSHTITVLVSSVSTGVQARTCAHTEHPFQQAGFFIIHEGENIQIIMSFCLCAKHFLCFSLTLQKRGRKGRNF